MWWIPLHSHSTGQGATGCLLADANRQVAAAALKACWGLICQGTGLLVPTTRLLLSLVKTMAAAVAAAAAAVTL